MVTARVRPIADWSARERTGVSTVEQRDEWAVPCRDLSGRRREMTIFASTDRVVVVAPPGETAILAPLDVGRLRAALRDAVMHIAQPVEGG